MELKELKTVCDLQNGYAFKSKDYVDLSNTVSLRMSNIRPGGTFDNSYNLRYLPDTFKDAYSNYIVEDGDLVIAMTDLANDPKILGVPTIVKTGTNTWLLNQRAGKLIVKDESKADKNYLRYILNHPIHRNYYKMFAGGGLQINVGKKEILGVKIPLPPLETQKRIAQILDNAAALRDTTAQLLKEYDLLAQSIFLEMFGDPVINPKNWDMQTIQQLVIQRKGSIKRGPFGGALKKEIFVERGYLVYEQYHALNNNFDFERYYINNEDFARLKGFEVKPGDIIISCSGVYLGKLAIIPEDAKEGIINQALLKVTLDEMKMRNEFFVFHFTQPNFRSKYFDATRGAGIPNFPPMTSFKKFPFISPPIKFQNQFAEKIALIEQQKATATQELQESEDLFNCLLQKAFKGELV